MSDNDMSMKEYFGNKSKKVSLGVGGIFGGFIGTVMALPMGSALACYAGVGVFLSGVVVAAVNTHHPHTTFKWPLILTSTMTSLALVFGVAAIDLDNRVEQHQKTISTMTENNILVSVEGPVKRAAEIVGRQNFAQDTEINAHEAAKKILTQFNAEQSKLYDSCMDSNKILQESVSAHIDCEQFKPVEIEKTLVPQ